MKRTLLFAIATLLAFGIAFGQTLNVTRPAGGERWTLGSREAITWDYSGITGNVVIRLVRPSGERAGRIANVPVSDRSFPWTVGQLATETAAAGEYSIQIYAADQDVTANSGRTISLVDPAGTAGDISNVRLSGTSPHRIGDPCTITWTVTGVSQPLRLQLTRTGGDIVGVIADPLPAGTATYNWTAGQYIGGTAGPGEDYKIRVAAADNSAASKSPEFALTNFTVGEFVFPGVAVLSRNLEMKGVRHVLSRGGYIVARVKNHLNAIAQDVSFRLTFPEGGGPGAQTVVRRVNLAAGAEGDIYLHPLAPDGVPPAGLLVRVMADGPTSQITETNEGDNTAEARFTILDVRVSAPRNDLELSRLYMQGGWDYRLKFKIRVTHNQANPVNNIRVKWEMFDSGGLMRFAGGSWTIESLAGGEEWVKTAEQKFGKDGRRNAHHPKLKEGATYRIVASITSPDDFSRNNSDGFSFTVPD